MKLSNDLNRQLQSVKHWDAAALDSMGAYVVAAASDHSTDRKLLFQTVCALIDRDSEYIAGFYFFNLLLKHKRTHYFKLIEKYLDSSAVFKRVPQRLQPRVRGFLVVWTTNPSLVGVWSIKIMRFFVEKVREFGMNDFEFSAKIVCRDNCSHSFTKYSAKDAYKATHRLENRRCLTRVEYKPVLCPNTACFYGDLCPKAHSLLEIECHYNSPECEAWKTSGVCTRRMCSKRHKDVVVAPSTTPVLKTETSVNEQLAKMSEGEFVSLLQSLPESKQSIMKRMFQQFRPPRDPSRPPPRALLPKVTYYLTDDFVNIRLKHEFEIKDTTNAKGNVIKKLTSKQSVQMMYSLIIDNYVAEVIGVKLKKSGDFSARFRDLRYSLEACMNKLKVPVFVLQDLKELTHVCHTAHHNEGKFETLPEGVDVNSPAVIVYGMKEFISFFDKLFRVFYYLKVLEKKIRVRYNEEKRNIVLRVSEGGESKAETSGKENDVKAVGVLKEQKVFGVLTDKVNDGSALVAGMGKISL